MNYFLAIPGQFCNISRPLRDNDFTINLTQGGKFFSFLFYTFRGNFDKDPITGNSFIRLSFIRKTRLEQFVFYLSYEKKLRFFVSHNSAGFH